MLEAGAKNRVRPGSINRAHRVQVNVKTSRDGADEAKRRAFAKHVEPQIEVLLSVARTLTRRGCDAEDLVQDTLLRAYRGIERFDGRYPRAWLLTILRNTHLNRQRRTRPDLLGHWDLQTRFRPAFGSVSEPNPEEVFMNATLDEALATAIDQLDPRFRAALLLVDVHDLSYAEAAAVLGVKPGTVMSRLSRARARVRHHLGSALLTPERKTP